MDKLHAPPPPPPNQQPMPSTAMDELEAWTKDSRNRVDHQTVKNGAEAYHHKSRQNGIKAFLQ